MTASLDPPPSASPPSLGLSRRGRVPPNTPPSPPRPSPPPSTSKALLVIPTPSLAFASPAGLDLIQRMLKRARAAHARQARHTSAAFAAHAAAGAGLTRYPSRVGPTRKVGSELHVVLLAGVEGGEGAVRGLERALGATGAVVKVHQVGGGQAGAKLSLVGMAKGKVQTTRARLEGALVEGGGLAEELGLDGGLVWADQGEEGRREVLTEVGFVFPHENEGDATESSAGFMKVIASRLGGKTPVTIYVAPRPTSADFDTDEAEPRSVRIAHAAADTLTKTIAANTPTIIDVTDDGDAVVIGARSSKRMSLDWAAINAAASAATNRMSTASGSSGHSRRHSYIQGNNGSFLDSATSAAKPLLLRPAPGPGPQSVSLRLALPGMDQDVVLRVAEAVSPVDEVRTFRHRPSNSIGSRAQDIQSEAGAEEGDSKRDSFLLPILSRGIGGSRSPSPSVVSFTSSSSRRSSRVSFTSSISEEAEDGPLTPPSPAAKGRLSSPPALSLDTAAHGRSLFSPVDLPSDEDTPVRGKGEGEADRYATLRKRRSEVVYGGGRQVDGGVFVEGDESPVWGGVAELLRGRREGAGERARGVGGLPIRLSQ